MTNGVKLRRWACPLAPKLQSGRVVETSGTHAKVIILGAMCGTHPAAARFKQGIHPVSAQAHQRRQLMGAALCLSAAAAGLALPARAQPARVKLPDVTEGPFYPSKRWRARLSDWDADLTRVRNGGQTLVAQGEHLGLDLQVVDTAGKAVDNIEFEIWQCDVLTVYRHPSDSERDESRMDKGFQGFGSGYTSAQGAVAFRTIKPVAYPGRTPHIHIKLRHATFGELTSQLFVAGDPGNARDGIWRRLGAQRQSALDMVLLPARGDELRDGLRWRVQHVVVVEA